MAALPISSFTVYSGPTGRTTWDDLEESDSPPAIVIVDDRDINRQLLRAMLRGSGYRILEARATTEALSLVRREKVDLIILDLMAAAGMNSLEFCRRVKADRQTQLIPVLMLTSVQGVENEVAGIDSGADEFLVKPLHPTVVRTRVRALLRNKSIVDRLEEAETILFALAQSIEHRDEYTAGHCQRLATYSVAIGAARGLSKRELQALYRGAFLHDIGKNPVPDSILFKKGKLTEEEWGIMRLHTVKGEEICRPMKTLSAVLPIIRNHHERWDGSGYPDGIGGEEIPVLARILQVADIYDALLTVRPYKAACTPARTLEIMKEEVQRGWRDPDLFDTFHELLASGSLDPPPPGPMQPSLENMRQELLK